MSLAVSYNNESAEITVLRDCQVIKTEKVEADMQPEISLTKFLGKAGADTQQVNCMYLIKSDLVTNIYVTH